MKKKTPFWFKILYVFVVNSLEEFWIIHRKDIPLFYWSKTPKHRTVDESDIIANYFAAIRKFGEVICHKIEVINLLGTRIIINDSFQDFFLVGTFMKKYSINKMKHIMKAIGSRFEAQFSEIISRFVGETNPFNQFHLWFF